MDAGAEGTPPAPGVVEDGVELVDVGGGSVPDDNLATRRRRRAGGMVAEGPEKLEAGEYLRMPRDKRSALWDSSEGARERAASRICAWQSTASDSDHASTKDQYASGLSSAKNSAVSRSVDVAWDTRKGRRSVSERREEPSWGGGRGKTR